MKFLKLLTYAANVTGLTYKILVTSVLIGHLVITTRKRIK